MVCTWVKCGYSWYCLTAMRHIFWPFVAVRQYSQSDICQKLLCYTIIFIKFIVIVFKFGKRTVILFVSTWKEGFAVWQIWYKSWVKSRNAVNKMNSPFLSKLYSFALVIKYHYIHWPYNSLIFMLYCLILLVKFIPSWIKSWLDKKKHQDFWNRNVCITLLANKYQN